MTDPAHALSRPEFPRSSRYDPDWLMRNQMGPNALWLLEWLCEALPLRPGMRVLDLGCGRAMSSVFLAKEFGARVWAADLWVPPDENWARVREAGCEDLVCPMRLEAHALPFAGGFFDAVVSIDAYQYFGTDDLYLAYLSRFVRPGCRIGIVAPALMRELTDGVPEHLLRPQANGKRFWEDECASFHTLDWWREHWKRSNRVTVETADVLADGCRHWRDFEAALVRAGHNVFLSDVEALEADAGRYLGFARLVAARNEVSGFNLYDPAIEVPSGE